MAPLVVDLDGTLTATDTLVESLIQLVKRNPLRLLALLFMLFRGRAAFKTWVAAHAAIDVALLPFRPQLVAYLEAQKARGRTIVLATAAHRSIAERVFAHFPFFDSWIGTQDGTNLKGEHKLAAIRRALGDDFVYAGDSAADLPIWRAARGALLVGASPAVSRAAAGLTRIERVFPRAPRQAATWLQALRVHQWLKNVLLFVPLLTAFSFFRLPDVLAVAQAFLAFSLAASATYICNDLWDLESDRQHPRKRFRPFASAVLPIGQGLAAAALLMAAALAIAAAVSPAFLAFLLVYIAATSAYTYMLKTRMLLDVLMLSLLYTLRILAGAAAIHLETSQWLLAFSMFVFLSLALVKRCSELVGLQGQQAHPDNPRRSLPGRDYRVADLAVLVPLGVATAACSIVVFGLFIHSPDTQARYLSPGLLWSTAFFLCYWLFRLWIKTIRGEMHDDPVVYAMVDRGSRLAVTGVVATMLLARFVPVRLFS